MANIQAYADGLPYDVRDKLSQRADQLADAALDTLRSEDWIEDEVDLILVYLFVSMVDRIAIERHAETIPHLVKLVQLVGQDGPFRRVAREFERQMAIAKEAEVQQT
jgi:hypothetical protein